MTYANMHNCNRGLINFNYTMSIKIKIQRGDNEIKSMLGGDKDDKIRRQKHTHKCAFTSASAGGEAVKKTFQIGNKLFVW